MSEDNSKKESGQAEEAVQQENMKDADVELAIQETIEKLCKVEGCTSTSEAAKAKIPLSKLADICPSKKERKKVYSDLEKVMRQLKDYSSVEEKLCALTRRYIDLYSEHSNTLIDMTRLNRSHDALMKEKQSLSNDLQKSLAARIRMENVCRELQRRNKELRDETDVKLKQERERQSSETEKFKETLSKIASQMKEDGVKAAELEGHNIAMNARIQEFYQHYQLKDKETEKLHVQMALEKKLYEAQFEKFKAEASAEKETLLHEKHQLRLTVKEYQEKIKEQAAIQVALRHQISLYNNKYEEFEKSLVHSNKVFCQFTEEMEAMSMQVAASQSEAVSWKQKFAALQQVLAEKSEDKTAKQIVALKKLCRTLQTERNELLAKLKGKGCGEKVEENLEGAEMLVESETTEGKEEIVLINGDSGEQAYKKEEENLNKDALFGNVFENELKLSPYEDETDVIIENKPLKREEGDGGVVNGVVAVTAAPQDVSKPFFPFPKSEQFSFTYNGATEIPKELENGSGKMNEIGGTQNRVKAVRSKKRAKATATLKNKT